MGEPANTRPQGATDEDDERGGVAVRPRPSTAWDRDGTSHAHSGAAGTTGALTGARTRRRAWQRVRGRLQAAVSLDADPDLRVWWRDEITGAAHEVYAVIDEHVDQTEGPRGLFAAILTDAPHTAGRVARLCNEHAELVGLSGQLRWQVERDDDAAIRALSRELLALLDEHHARGAEVLHHAYAIDVGVAD